jgi:hypothetical protein
MGILLPLLGLDYDYWIKILYKRDGVYRITKKEIKLLVKQIVFPDFTYNELANIFKCQIELMNLRFKCKHDYDRILLKKYINSYLFRLTDEKYIDFLENISDEQLIKYPDSLDLIIYKTYIEYIQQQSLSYF